MKDLMVNGSANLPAHARAEGTSNLAGDMVGAGYPRLSFKGNRFHVKMGGDDRVLGGTELRVVILEANPHVSRIYFDSQWDGETATRPACGSEDGVTPLPTVAEPQSSTCATCPMNEKGSAISDTGGKTRACSFYKRTAVLLVDEPQLGPLQADMKAMSMFGTSYPDKGAFSLRDYAKRLDTNKVLPHAVITELSFDVNQSVPKLLFRAVDFTSDEFHTQHIAPLMEDGDLQQMVSTADVNTTGEDDQQSGVVAPDALSEPKPAHADAEIEKHGTDTPPEEEEKEELTPAQKAARTRAANKAKKEAEEKAAAEAAEAEANEAAEAESDPDLAFDDDLEDALSEFGF